MVAGSVNEREIGHSGNFFSYVWGPLGVAHAGGPTLARFMAEQRWYYDLARRWDHGLICQPIPEKSEGGQGMGNYVSHGPLWGTGGMALVYALPQPRLRILGAPRRAPDAALVAKSIELTLTSVKADMDAGDLYRAKCKLDALPAGDARCAAWRKQLADPAREPVLKAGQQFYEVRQLAKTDDCRFVEQFTFNKRARGILSGLCKNNRAGVYQQLAAKLLATAPAS